MNYAEVALNTEICKKFPTFTYQIPVELKNIKPGNSVLAPFKTQILEGIVISLHKNKPQYPTKKILKKTENLLLPYQFKLTKFISDYYFCDIFKAIKLFLPEKIWNRQFKIKKNSTNQCNNIGVRDIPNDKKPDTSISNILSQTKPIFFKEGIFTKKLDIYLKITEQNIQNNKQTLIIIPEILGAQPIFQIFRENFGNTSAIFHNKLSESEKLTQYLLIKKNKTKIIIGTKLALFLPYSDLNTIIIDSEHEKLYKNEQHPQYDARTLALEIHKYLNIPILLQSPSPRLETYHLALQKKYVTLKIKTPDKKPDIHVINLNDEIKYKNFSIFSESLVEKIKECLKNKNQIILSVNKLGSSNTITCKDCGYIEKCQNCNTNLRLDNNKKILFCIHCAFKKEVPTICPNCNSTIIKFKGTGTQKIETEAKKLFPNAKILRADRETSTKKHFEEEIYKKLKNNKVDILIGTQIVSKNLNLPNIKLACNLLADIGSNIPDFRAQEYHYQNINNFFYSLNEGELLIQTYNPENLTLKLAISDNFHAFALTELKTRKQLFLPPFSKQIKISTIEDSEEKAEYNAQKLSDYLNNYLKIYTQDKNSINIINFPAFVSKKNNKHIWQTLIASRQHLGSLNQDLFNKKNTKIEVDPISQ